MARRFVLRVELIPEPLWQMNLRSNKVGLGQGRWRKLSRSTRDRLRECSICGNRKRRLHGHEVWKLSETARKGVARLTAVNAICVVCHSIQHWGMTRVLINIGALSAADGQRLIRHFTKINVCTEAAFSRHVVRAFAQHHLRSKKKWTIDWGPFTAAVAEAKVAREKWHAARKERG